MSPNVASQLKWFLCTSIALFEHWFLTNNDCFSLGHRLRYMHMHIACSVVGCPRLGGFFVALFPVDRKAYDMEDESFGGAAVMQSCWCHWRLKWPRCLPYPSLPLPPSPLLLYAQCAPRSAVTAFQYMIIFPFPNSYANLMGHGTCQFGLTGTKVPASSG